MSSCHLIPRGLHFHICRKAEKMSRCSCVYPTMVITFVGAYSSSAIWTDIGLLGDLPACTRPIHIPLHWIFLPKRHTWHLKILHYFLRHIHLDWAAYSVHPHSIPQSIFPAFSSTACQLPEPPNLYYRHPELHTGSWPQRASDFPLPSICWKLQQSRHASFSA